MKHTSLQKMRDEAGATNAEIARTLRVSESFISKIMSGARKNILVEINIAEFLKQQKEKTNAK